MKTVISFKKKECNVRYYKNNLLFTFKGSKYAMNILFFVNFFCRFLEILKKLSGCFLKLNICRKFRISVITPSQ